jgi:hypothetical protein
MKNQGGKILTFSDTSFLSSIRNTKQIQTEGLFIPGKILGQEELSSHGPRVPNALGCCLTYFFLILPPHQVIPEPDIIRVLLKDGYGDLASAT